MNLLKIVSFLISFHTSIGKTPFFSKILGETIKDDLPTRYISVEKPFQIYENGKEDMEAEVAFLTQDLGFVNCDKEQKPRLHKYVKEYIRMKTENKIEIGPILYDSFRNVSNEEKIKLCQNYLKDDVLRDNKIYLQENINPEQIEVVYETLLFTYFFVEEEDIKAVQCPVVVNGVETLIYFSGFGKTDKEDVGQYYVMAKITEENDSNLTILMRTILHSNDVDTEKKIDIKSSVDFIQESQNKCILQLNVISDKFDIEYRLFGRDAERAYITSEWGFLHFTNDRNTMDRFVDITLQLRKGYRTSPIPLDPTAIATLPFELKLDTCRILLRCATFLTKADVDENAFKDQIQGVYKKISYSLPSVPSEDTSFLQCPVEYEGIKQAGLMLYVKPVFYDKHSKCDTQVFLSVSSEDEIGKNQIKFYSKLDWSQISVDELHYINLEDRSNEYHLKNILEDFTRLVIKETKTGYWSPKLGFENKCKRSVKLKNLPISKQRNESKNKQVLVDGYESADEDEDEDEDEEEEE